MALLFVAIMGLSAPSYGEEKNPKVAWEHIQQGAMVVDVRTPEEFAEGHLKNAINIPFENIAEEFTKRNIAKDQSVVLYCRSGRRSGIAQESLVKLGYSNTYNGGGYQSLAKH
ncbi:rhodanese-like domain-containing protein [Shewanella insulae]|nr:rhodanese-like domain-containing protein [Shewanella insulae]MCG9714073.1 rhodanese-like domain-containing protein [Shewanella insulae]MCG9737247.1 rhodanese-like domain-containing protein [Shewanella insulae]